MLWFDEKDLLKLELKIKRKELTQTKGELSTAKNDLQIMDTQLKNAQITLKQYQTGVNNSGDQNINESNMLR